MSNQAREHSHTIVSTDRPKAEVIQNWQLEHPDCKITHTSHSNGMLTILYQKKTEIEAAAEQASSNPGVRVGSMNLEWPTRNR